MSHHKSSVLWVICYWSDAKQQGADEKTNSIKDQEKLLLRMPERSLHSSLPWSILMCFCLLINTFKPCPRQQLDFGHAITYQRAQGFKLQLFVCLTLFTDIFLNNTLVKWLKRKKCNCVFSESYYFLSPHTTISGIIEKLMILNWT